ncbi:oxygenase MpaB family protein [Solwaraspora sp. WMMD406]|uniref:oxygenase MpaB family protein n=1 Tax=Solwaraspora sp. WMMD406 TaxID=3016095 RepID=UPI0024162DDB|nr:oxygenase MpaB family protein [Solwaraspora sp. WMMD406]MDG4766029.1 oxygenase MpaB family protein [Solwaraspora sp. WMMD406]
MKDRYANLRRIRTQDPERDYLEIYQTMVRREFPWDSKLGLNLAFNRSFSLPRVAALHVATGELLRHTRKRVDDTGLLMYEMLLHGFDHPRGRESVRRINQIHHRYDIADEDYRYVLGCLVVVPIRWLGRYGWRAPCCHERAAAYHYYRQLGRRMGIDDIPGSYDEFAAWFDAYDAAQLRFSPQAARIEQATRALLRGRLPRPLAPVGDALVTAMYDDRLRAATGLTAAPVAVRVGLHVGLRLRAGLLRWAARPRRQPLFADGIRTPTYPDGYRISDLGPAGQ